MPTTGRRMTDLRRALCCAVAAGALLVGCSSGSGGGGGGGGSSPTMPVTGHGSGSGGFNTAGRISGNFTGGGSHVSGTLTNPTSETYRGTVAVTECTHAPGTWVTVAPDPVTIGPHGDLDFEVELKDPPVVASSRQICVRLSGRATMIKGPLSGGGPATPSKSASPEVSVSSKASVSPRPASPSASASPGSP